MHIIDIGGCGETNPPGASSPEALTGIDASCLRGSILGEARGTVVDRVAYTCAYDRVRSAILLEEIGRISDRQIEDFLERSQNPGDPDYPILRRLKVDAVSIAIDILGTTGEPVSPEDMMNLIRLQVRRHLAQKLTDSRMESVEVEVSGEDIRFAERVVPTVSQIRPGYWDALERVGLVSYRVPTYGLGLGEGNVVFEHYRNMVLNEAKREVLKRYQTLGELYPKLVELRGVCELNDDYEVVSFGYGLIGTPLWELIKSLVSERGVTIPDRKEEGVKKNEYISYVRMLILDCIGLREDSTSKREDMWLKLVELVKNYNTTEGDRAIESLDSEFKAAFTLLLIVCQKGGLDIESLGSKLNNFSVSDIEKFVRGLEVVAKDSRSVLEPFKGAPQFERMEKQLELIRVLVDSNILKHLTGCESYYGNGYIWGLYVWLDAMMHIDSSSKTGRILINGIRSGEEGSEVLAPEYETKYVPKTLERIKKAIEDGRLKPSQIEAMKKLGIGPKEWLRVAEAHERSLIKKGFPLSSIIRVVAASAAMGGVFLLGSPVLTTASLLVLGVYAAGNVAGAAVSGLGGMKKLIQGIIDEFEYNRRVSSGEPVDPYRESLSKKFQREIKNGFRRLIAGGIGGVAGGLLGLSAGVVLGPLSGILPTGLMALGSAWERKARAKDRSKLSLIEREIMGVEGIVRLDLEIPEAGSGKFITPEELLRKSKEYWETVEKLTGGSVLGDIVSGAVVGSSIGCYWGVGPVQGHLPGLGHYVIPGIRRP